MSLKDTLKIEIEQLTDELIRLRRDFHQHPELGFEEYRTAGIVSDYLREQGIEVERVAETGVIGILRGQEDGPVLMLRADMDALPMDEKTDVSFRSIYEGKMHACGHDGHTAMLMVAAKILAKHREEIKGTIKFVFQPNEEDAGAAIIIEEGVMENPKVDAALGIHLWSPLSSGKVGITAGPLMASSYYFWLTIKGKGGHGGAPHLAVDPIFCGKEIMNALQSLQTREQDVLKPTLINFGQFHAGTNPIIISQQAELAGSVRCLHNEDARIRQRFEEIVAHVCRMYGADYELTFKCGNELLTNDLEMTNLIKQSATEAFGVESLQETDLTVMLGEDFASFANMVPSAFYFLGIGNKEKKTDMPHHHPEFKLDEEVLALGVEMHIRGAMAYFEKIQK
ncbi:amidohydrolase [Tindallia magadiensis]|uniref:Amidohydrolase n=1 Tax=Tindallia magadiensis TaxID=69895 RepID=A0A1I3DYI3_9FIRM|nr:amidohydrolase [Tindallia magadiensis]SFH91776.1 amidohydrolase [Tindallia magadiensis]